MCENCKNCDCVKFFVYGTLKNGGRLNGGIKDLVKKEFGYVVANLVSSYQLHNLGWYPGLVNAGTGAYEVSGEVIIIPAEAVQVLDRIEGAQYERTGVVVRDTEGNEHSCLTYTVKDAYVDSSWPVIESGMWNVENNDND